MQIARINEKLKNARSNQETSQKNNNHISSSETFPFS